MMSCALLLFSMLTNPLQSSVGTANDYWQQFYPALPYTPYPYIGAHYSPNNELWILGAGNLNTQTKYYLNVSDSNPQWQSIAVTVPNASFIETSSIWCGTQCSTTIGQYVYITDWYCYSCPSQEPQSMLIFDLANREYVDTTSYASTTLQATGYQCTTNDDVKVYVLGGYSYGSGGIYLNKVQIYNPSTDSWTLGPSMPRAIGEHGCAYTNYNNKIYTLGGRSSSVDDGKWIQEYDINNGLWTELTVTLNDGREGLDCMGCSSGNIICYGGYDGQTIDRNGELFNIPNMMVVSIPILYYQAHPSLVYLSDSFYIYSGPDATATNGSSPYQIVDYIQYSKCSWFDDIFPSSAPASCEDSGDIMHIDWDLMVNDINDDQVPYNNVSVDVDETELTVNIEANLGYLGASCADNGICGFGTTYFISLNSFSSNTLDIFSSNGLSECDNRLPSSFVGTSWAEKWNVSETPYIKNHVGSDTYLAYPPSGDYWNLTAFDVDSGNKCDRIKYFGSFSWFDLQNKCKNPQTTESSTEILVDNDWINLTGIFYINIISPLYKDSDSGMYRIYELINDQFTMAVSKSINILGSTGISLYKISIIAVNTDSGKFTLDILSEAVDYLQLSSETILISPNGYQFDINPLNNGDCLSFKSNICIQTWQITTIHNESCNNFGGIYGFQWIAQCNPNIVNNTRCLQYNGDVVTLSVETDFEDKTCDIDIGITQFDGDMRFYQNDSFIGNSNNDYSFIVGRDSIYVEIELNYPPNTYSIFNSKLINVWLCTIDDQVYGSTFSVSQRNPSNTGCLSSIIDNDGYNPYWIIKDYDETFEYDAMHINNTNNNNVVRFSFKTPYTLTRDTLWVHTQIELSLISNRRRVLFDTSSSSSIGQMRHFISSINTENAIIDDIMSTDTVSTTQKKEQEETDNAISVKATFYFLSIILVSIFL